MTPSPHADPPYDAASLRQALRTRAIGLHVQYKTSVDSTNAEAIRLAQNGASHGTVVLADRQTAGRGRQGRAWFSPAMNNIYCSVILKIGPGRLPNLTLIPLASVLAAADGIFDSTGIRAALKWPNDLMIGDKKLGGILCENVGGQPDTTIVVGIGVNANSSRDEFPPDLKGRVTSLMDELGSPVERTGLLAAILDRFEQRMEFLSPEKTPLLLETYAARCATLGMPVRVVMTNAACVEGIAEKIGDDGALHVRLPFDRGTGRPGSLVEIRSADIVHLRGMTARS
jgi:BirA family biotin operon repressor/biotin-[acetyl-CoA-carboxylase] ligase